MSETLLPISVEELLPDPDQPRKSFRPAELQRLADSMRARGCLSPLRVMKKNGRWVIVAGESRWRSAKLAGVLTVPCIVVDECGEADLLQDRIVENHVRSDLNSIELGRSLVRLKRLRGCTASELAKDTGLRDCELSKLNSLLSLSPLVQKQIEDGSLAPSHGYELSRLRGNEAAQEELANEIIAKRLNRKTVIERVAALLGMAKMSKEQRLSGKLDGVSYTLSMETLTIDVLADFFLRQSNKIKTARKNDTPLADLLADLGQLA